MVVMSDPDRTTELIDTQAVRSWMDGVGLGPDYAGNAVKAARKPVLDQLMATCPWTKLAAHGVARQISSNSIDDGWNSILLSPSKMGFPRMIGKDGSS